MPLAALAQVPTPVADDLRTEPSHDLTVRRYGKVLEVPADDAAEPFPLYWHRVVSTTFQGHIDALERRPHSLRIGVTGHDPPRLPCRAISSLRTRLVRPVSDLRRASTRLDLAQQAV
jgi:hypothetical protein